MHCLCQLITLFYFYFVTVLWTAETLNFHAINIFCSHITVYGNVYWIFYQPAALRRVVKVSCRSHLPKIILLWWMISLWLLISLSLLSIIPQCTYKCHSKTEDYSLLISAGLILNHQITYKLLNKAWKYSENMILGRNIYSLSLYTTTEFNEKFRLMVTYFNCFHEEVNTFWNSSKSRNERLQSLCFSPNIIMMIKPRRMTWTEHVARMWEVISACKYL